jgi:hypothetical protein
MSARLRGGHVGARSRLALAAATAFALLAAPLAAADQTGPDCVPSDNVEYLDSIKQDVGPRRPVVWQQPVGDVLEAASPRLRADLDALSHLTVRAPM